MTGYSIALFLHIGGALLLIAALAIEGFTLGRGTTAATVNRVVGPIAALLILVPGFYLVFTGAGWSGWVVVGITSYVLIAVLGAFTGISVIRGSMSARVAAISWCFRVGLATGVVFDMTVKPNLVISVIAVVVAAAAGLTASAAAVRRAQSA